VKLIDLREGAYKAAIDRQAKYLANDVAKYDRATRKFWAKHLSKEVALAIARMHQRPSDEVRITLVKKIMKMLGEDMKVNEVVNAQGLEQGVPVVDRPQYKVFVDLDGVLVDFDKQMTKIGFPREVLERDKQAKRKFWQTVGWMAKNGKPFWGIMEPMPDAAQLWNYLNKQHTKPEILSATGHVGNAVEEKHDWVKRHLGPQVKVHLTRKSSDKAQFAAPNHILIDDRAQSIEPFIAAGGIGILHKNAASTIAQLKELGL